MNRNYHYWGRCLSQIISLRKIYIVEVLFEATNVILQNQVSMQALTYTNMYTLFSVLLVGNKVDVVPYALLILQFRMDLQFCLNDYHIRTNKTKRIWQWRLLVIILNSYRTSKIYPPTLLNRKPLSRPITDYTTVVEFIAWRHTSSHIYTHTHMDNDWNGLEHPPDKIRPTALRNKIR